MVTRRVHRSPPLLSQALSVFLYSFYRHEINKRRTKDRCGEVTTLARNMPELLAWLRRKKELFYEVKLPSKERVGLWNRKKE
jgi:hypothetical protein